MTKPYDLIIFDWDGTLADSRVKIFNAMRHGCKKNNYPAPTDDELANQVGLSLEKVFQNLYPNKKDLPISLLIEGYEEYFFNNPSESELFEGTVDVLQHLEKSGYLLAIATGKRRAPLERDLHYFGINQFFTITRTPNESPSKPSPQMLFDILDFTGVEAKRAVMVGDSIYDLQAAQNANMDAIAVSYGIKSIHELKQYYYTHILEKITDLPRLLENI